jgi:uncharacterized surface protein with fasciclin (FAS1) repeats
MAADVGKLATAKTAQGQSIDIVAKKSGVTINGVNAIICDIACTNSVIHVMDAVLLPPAAAK